MRQKTFRAWKKQQKRRKRAKAKVKLFEKGELKLEQLPRLSRDLIARKRRRAAKASA